MTAREAILRQMEIISKKSETASASELVDLTIILTNCSIELRRLTA